MDEQERDFDPAALLLLLPFAMALWKKHAPKRYTKKPSSNFLVRVTIGVKAEMRKQTRLLIDGKISLAQWELDFRRYKDAIYIISTAVQAGTFDIGTPALSIGSEIWRFQEGKATERIGQINTGDQKLNGTLLTTVGLYATAGWAMYQGINSAVAGVMGAVTSQRFLGAADHCQDCEDAEKLGRQPYGTLPAIGDSVCGANCHCTMKHYDAQGKEVSL